MLSFYEYLNWWVDQQQEFWRSLSLTKPKANTEFSVIAEMTEASLTILDERLTPAQAEFLNEALEKICKFNKVVMGEPQHALGYMINLFIAYDDYESHKPPNESVLLTTFIHRISILHTSTWTRDGKQEPLFRVDKLISFWKKQGESFLRRISVKEQTAFGFNQLPIDFFWIKKSTLSKERSKEEILDHFPHVPDLQWSHVSMTFPSESELRVEAEGGHKKIFHYAYIGFKDKRKKDHWDSRWDYLRSIAELHGTFKNFDYKFVKAVQTINQRLREVMQIDENPIYYDKKAHAYKTKFKITDKINYPYKESS